MWIADNLWEERDEGQVHYLLGLRPLDVDEDIVELAKSMGIHIIPRAERKNVSARLFQQAFLINVHHHGDSNTNPTDEPPGDIQEMLKHFQGHFCEPT
jgi:hypothetical protein